MSISVNNDILVKFNAISQQKLAEAKACCKLKKVDKTHSCDNVDLNLALIEDAASILYAAEMAMREGRNEYSDQLVEQFIRKFNDLNSNVDQSIPDTGTRNNAGDHIEERDYKKDVVSEKAVPEDNNRKLGKLRSTYSNQNISNSTGTKNKIQFYEDFNDLSNDSVAVYDEQIGSYSKRSWNGEWETKDPFSAHSSTVKLVEDPQDGGSRGKVMRVEYKPKSSTSASRARPVLERPIEPPTEDIYFSYDLYFPEKGKGSVYDYTSGEKEMYHSVGVLPGLMASRADTIDSGSKHTQVWPSGPKWQSSSFGYELIGLGSQSNYQFDSSSELVIMPGNWKSLEYHYKLNSPSQANGRFQIWVDGKLVIDDSHVTYRDDSSEIIDKMSFDTAYEIFTGSDPSEKKYIYFDNFVVSSSPITH